MRKMRSDNPLASLTEAQLDEIYNWLHEGQSYKDVRARLTSPPPDGFSIKVSIPTLCHFYKQRRVEQRIADTLELEILPSEPVQAQKLHTATTQAFAHIAYETAHSPETAKSFAILASWLTRYEYNEIQRQNLELAKLQFEANRERIELSRQRLQLETFKAQYNAARVTLEHVHKLQKILDDPTIDDQARIDKSRPVLFGAKTAPTPEPQ